MTLNEKPHKKSMTTKLIYENHINPFVPSAPFLYPLKSSENRKNFLFSGGRERMHWEKMG